MTNTGETRTGTKEEGETIRTICWFKTGGGIPMQMEGVS